MQTGAREDGGPTVQFLAEGRNGASPVRRTKRCEENSELVGIDFNVCGCRQGGLDQRAPFIGSAPVIRRNEMHKITLGLISNHFDEIGEELALWVKFDDVLSNSVTHRNSDGHCFALSFEFGNAIEGFSNAPCELPLGAFRVSRGRADMFGMHEGLSPIIRGKPFELCTHLLQLDGHLDSFRIGDIAGRIVRNNVVIYQGIQRVLFAKIFEEVLLSPAFKHSESYLQGRKIAPGCQDRSLVAVLTQSRDLPQAELPSQETDSLIRQHIGHRAAVDNSLVESEARPCHPAGGSLAIGSGLSQNKCTILGGSGCILPKEW